MSIAEKLRKLLDIKGAIKEALFLVGQEVADKMEDWAMEIRNICNVPFENLGWSAEESRMLNATLKNMYLNGMYSKNKLNGESGGYPFLGAYKFPFVSKNGDSQLDTYSDILGSNYLTAPFVKILYTKSNLSNHNTKYTGAIYIDVDFSQLVAFNNAFSDCSSLTVLKMNVTNVTDFGNFMSFNTAGRANGLRSIQLRGLGTQSDATSISFRYATVLGIPYKETNSLTNDILTTNARQDLIDTLLTNSFDRASAGYSVFTITLSQETFNLLTEEEITAITAKGYTITVG